MTGLPDDHSPPLLVLVGVTATRHSRSNILRYFASRGPYRTYVPWLPFRCGVRLTALWLKHYIARTVIANGNEPINLLAYIGGGAVLRHLATVAPLPPVARALYVRGPVQECVPAAIVKRYGRMPACLMAGRTMIDLADGWPLQLPCPHAAGEQGLILEEGVSALAGSLGLDAHSVPPDGWNPARLLPAASTVAHVRESHDEIYTSPDVLRLALHFFRTGSLDAHST